MQDSTNQIPDVLQTIAQLPSDDVYTSPRVANLVLDLLPGEVWTSRPEFKWLDPCAKSGVFLREAFRRLMIGLEGEFADPRKRRSHILKNMLFGAATTQLNGEMSRRTLYQSMDATGRGIRDENLADLAVKFKNSDGNIPFVATAHTLDKAEKACVICRAPANLVRENRESFAYSFIHGTYPTEEIDNMQFDVIIGNPPYQIGMEDAEGNRTANITPLYNLFVERAIAMNPRYISMITPSRWFAGGKGLVGFRNSMIADRRLRAITDIPNAREAFPTVEVKGGVSFFLWDREWDGDCEFTSFRDGKVHSQDTRDLRKYGDVILRDSAGVGVVDRVLSAHKDWGSLQELVSNRDPFGQSLTSNFKNARAKTFKGAIPLIFNNQVGYISHSQIERNHEWIDRWKIIIPKASDGAWRQNSSVLGEPIALAPGSVCTQSYLVVGPFESEEETRNCAVYLTTKFCRFLVLQKKITQNMTSSMFGFVPKVDLHKAWTDHELYALFGLSDEQVETIEKAVGSREWIDSLDSAIPSTHLPGGRKYKVVEDVDDPLDD